MRRRREEYQNNSAIQNHIIQNGSRITTVSEEYHIPYHALNTRLATKKSNKVIHEINFYPLLHSALDAVVKQRQDTSIDWNIKVNQKSHFFTDQFRLLILLNKILHHVIGSQDGMKEERFADIEVNSTMQEAIIEIVDNGKGITSTAKAKIYDLFNRAINSADAFNSGHHAFNDRVGHVSGCINIYSSPGIGTQYTIKLANDLLHFRKPAA